MLEKEYKFADPTSEVIFHAYPQSPVAEKVRVVFASKDLNGAAWKFRVHALEVLHKNSSVRAGFEGRQADTRRFCCTELDDEGPNIRIIRVKAGCDRREFLDQRSVLTLPCKNAQHQLVEFGAGIGDASEEVEQVSALGQVNVVGEQLLAKDCRSLLVGLFQDRVPLAPISIAFMQPAGDFKGIAFEQCAIHADGHRVFSEKRKLPVGRVDKRDSQLPLGMIQAGICDGDQLGTRPDVGRGMGVL